jgi:hypothetical protein
VGSIERLGELARLAVAHAGRDLAHGGVGRREHTAGNGGRQDKPSLKERLFGRRHQDDGGSVRRQVRRERDPETGRVRREGVMSHHRGR